MYFFLLLLMAPKELHHQGINLEAQSFWHQENSHAISWDYLYDHL
jgi:hypothetical protein